MLAGSVDASRIFLLLRFLTVVHAHAAAVHRGREEGCAVQLPTKLTKTAFSIVVAAAQFGLHAHAAASPPGFCFPPAGRYRFPALITVRHR